MASYGYRMTFCQMSIKRGMVVDEMLVNHNAIAGFLSDYRPRVPGERTRTSALGDTSF